MNHIDVPDYLVQELLEKAAWKQTGKTILTEASESSDKRKVNEANMFGNEDQVIEEDCSEESYACPMCDSTLEEALSDDKIMECVDNICAVLEELNEEATEEDDTDEEEGE